MFTRLLGLLLVPLIGILGTPPPVQASPGPVTPHDASVAPVAAPASFTGSSPRSFLAWPYPKGCLETELYDFFAERLPDEGSIDIQLLGVSRPCPNAPVRIKGVRLAMTQYHVVQGQTVGWMGDPWRTNSIGDMKFRRWGLVPDGLVAMCVSTGLTVRRHGVLAQHSQCFRPKWSEDFEDYARDWEPVPTDDPSVSVPLRRLPKPGASAPAGCWNCLIGDPVAPMPTPQAMPQPATVHPGCVRMRMDAATVDQERKVRVAGSFRPCVPGQMDEVSLRSAFYSARGSRLGQIWYYPEQEEVYQFDRDRTLLPNENAVCVLSGWRETDDGSYAHHELCLAVKKDHRGKLSVIRIPPDDPRVRKPIDVLDDGYPGHPSCATCL